MCNTFIEKEIQANEELEHTIATQKEQSESIAKQLGKPFQVFLIALYFNLKFTLSFSYLLLWYNTLILFILLPFTA